VNKTWPTLFKTNSNGSTQQWTIGVIVDPTTSGVYIQKEYGQVGGKLQVSDPDWIKGKNVGKANETTDYDQAVLEAQAQWTKKKTGGKGYVESTEDAAAGKVDELVKGGVNPMLAHSFAKQGHKIVYPAAAQPKLDGIRCEANCVDASLWTRTRKPIVSMVHIQEAVLRACVEGSDTSIYLDGELYNHDYKDKFEEIVSLVRPEYVKPGASVVQYHMYDIVMPGTFKERFDFLVENFGDLPATSPLKLVETVIVNNESELMEAFEHFVAEGYEGAIVRNLFSPYEQKRSYNLQKIKEFDDAEFRIVGIEEGRGKMAGLAIFECETQKGVTFMVKMKGSLEALRKYVDDPSLAFHKYLTVQYQGLTNGGVPRFPVGLSIRDYE
jgi:DNA ligase 1